MNGWKLKCSLNNEEGINISDLLDKGIKTLLKLDVIYERGDIEKKREVIGPIFLEKFSFSKCGDRTGRINGGYSDNIHAG